MSRETVEIQKELFAERKSAFAKYCDLIVGSRALGTVLLYEFVVMLAISCPGALGLALRRLMVPWLLGSCGRNVTFGRDIVLRHPHKLHVADNVVIDDHVVLDAKGQSNDGIRIGPGVFVGRGTILSCKNGDIVLGANVNIGFNCEIFSASRVALGDHTLVAAYTYLIGGNHDFDRTDVAVLEQGRSSKGIEIGSAAWLGAGVKVLDGVRIGSHAIIGTGAVVMDDVVDYAVAVGIPARTIKDRRTGDA